MIAFFCENVMQLWRNISIFAILLLNLGLFIVLFVFFLVKKNIYKGKPLTETKLYYFENYEHFVNISPEKIKT